MRYSYFFLILLPCSLLFSCNTKDSGNWQKPKEGKFEYQVIETAQTKKEAATLEYGDEISLHFCLRKEDGTVIESSYNKAPVRIVLPTKMHRNAFEEALTYTRPGDSLLARIRFADAPRELVNYKTHFKNGSEYAVFSYKVLNVFTLRQKSEEKDKKYALMNGFASTEDFKIEQQRVLKENAALRAKLLSNIKDKKARKLKPEKSAEGLEILTHTEGSGPKAMPGDTVFFYYIAALQKEETIFDDVFKLAARLILVVDQADNLPKMLHQSVKHLQKNSKATIFVPSKLGYGEKGSKPIVPPHSDLSLYLEIVDIKPLKPHE